MPVIVCNVAALMVAGLYYAWRAYHACQEQRLRTLRERVTYMLWVMVQPLHSTSASRTPVRKMPA